MKILDKETGEYKELRIKPGGDTLPIGTIVEYDGDSVPEGYEEVEEIEDLSDLITDINENINTTGSRIFLYKSDKIIHLFATISRSGSWTTNDVLFKIPTQYLPKANENKDRTIIFPILVTGFKPDSASINSLTGEVKLPAVINANNWLCINTTYICK